jgi:hypothetical protein
MRRAFAAVAALLFASIAPLETAAPSTPILVELFTSEGCSDCPPADVLLDRLVTAPPVAGAQIVALGQHVDYWDRLGWKDRFSSAALTNRQRLYGARFGGDSIYTPQMVVDGAAEFVGSDAGAAQRAVTKSLTAPHGTVTIDLDGSARGASTVAVTVAVRDLPTIERGDHADISIAITEDHLQTSVKGGENHGRTLSHTAVVRELRTIGEATADPSTAHGDVTLAPDWQRPALKVVAFVQERRSRRVLASAAARLDATRP